MTLTATLPTEIEVWNNGERQAAPSLAGIRPDHVGRYQFAADVIRLDLQPKQAADVRILDAACGVGYGARLIADAVLSAHVTGVDLSAAAIAYGQAHYAAPGCTLVQGDCTNLALPDRSVDAVLSFETLEHLDARAALASFRHVLRPGGLLIASTPNEDVLPWTPDFLHHLRHYTGAEFDALLQGAGFRIVSRWSNAGRLLETIDKGYGGPFNIAVARLER
jgi:SAM-dependent methyltransferase